jgi:hypothetical protein
MELIGLSGYAGSGKDEAANVLMRHAGFTRIAFADVLRDVALAIDPYVEYSPGDDIEPGKYWRLTDVIDTFGWDTAKNTLPDVRRLLQRLGTEAGREILGDNIWVDTAFKNAQADKIVITDCRFPNEAAAVRERGGLVVRIHRPGVGPRNDHASETSLTDYDFDFHIVNDGSLERFHKKVLDALT